MRVVTMGVAVAATFLTACHNGSNNARDTTGMPNTSAAGSAGASGTGTAGATTATAPGAMAPGATGATGATGAVPTDTTHRDSIRDTTRKKP